ncbi:MAG: DegT/DnrJ/EryC1/StrS family aminotransferase [Acidobacteriota bacterium]|nr:DegT/DnrJ/EryC1/StrS family aminotransferase [Acidobacteriota bacterium]
MPIKYHLAEDTIDESDIDHLISWLQTYPRLTKGEVTFEFEQKWSHWLGANHSIFCNSGSSANLLMYSALKESGRLKNMKVIVPSVGWITTVAPAIQLGFEAIMCEADEETFALDLNHLEHLIDQHNPATVTLVQVLGVPAKMDEILAMKDKHGFFLLEDACASIGAKYKDRNLGSFGDMGSFSFYFGHQMSTIEGGMVSTNDKEFSDLLLMHRSHGWSKDLDPHTNDQLVKDHEIDDFHAPFVFYGLGFNLRSTDLNAYIGIRQIEKLEWIVARRSENHDHYLNHLGNDLYFQKAPDHSQVCSIHCGSLAKDREQRRSVVKALVDNGIETRIFSAGNLGLHPFWEKRYGPSSFPMADRIHHCGFFLPNHPSLELESVDLICKVVKGAL